MTETPKTGDRYRHLKRGSEYTIIGTASLQIATDTAVDGSDVVLYQSSEYPQVLAREVGEFMDGRFERMTSPKTVTPDQPQAVPDMVLVPREPTEEMLRAGVQATWKDASDWEDRDIAATWQVCEAYRAMLAARPVLPVETPAEGLREPSDALATVWTYNYLSERAQALGESQDEDEMMESATDIVAGYKKYRPAPAPLSGRDGSLREAVAKFFEEIGGEPEKDCWDTENGEPEEEGEKFASDWSWGDHHKRVAKAHDNLRAALASTTPAPLSGKDGSLREGDLSARLLAAVAATRECLNDTVDYHEQGMGCGLEDRCITDRYEAMRYGWDEALDRVHDGIIKFAIEELDAALAAVPPETAEMEGAARDVLAERERQKTVEGWTLEHDDQHANAELARAAACYAMTASYGRFTPPDHWPWGAEWWKPAQTQRGDLIKAGALILAEIERIDRLAARASSSGEAGDA